MFRQKLLSSSVNLLIIIALKVEFIISRKMLIMLNGDNKKEAKRESVRIKSMV